MAARKEMRIVTMCKMTPKGVRLNMKNFIVLSCGVTELLRKVSQGRNPPPPPGEVRLRSFENIVTKLSNVSNIISAKFHCYARFFLEFLQFL